MNKVEILAERCKSCGYCVKYCPRQVLAIGRRVNSKGYEYVEVVQNEMCVSCAICARMCPDGAINVYR